MTVRRPMGTYDRTEIIMGSKQHNCTISDEFDTCEREKTFACSELEQAVSEFQTITDCHGRTYLVTDVMVSPEEAVRRIRVTPIDLDGHEF